MWKRQTNDIPHAVMTDYYIQKRKLASFTPAKCEPRVPYFKDLTGVDQLYHIKGTDASKAGNYSSAIQWFEQAKALKLAPDSAEIRRDLEDVRRSLHSCASL
jgi:hypothetical protein